MVKKERGAGGWRRTAPRDGEVRVAEGPRGRGVKGAVGKGRLREGVAAEPRAVPGPRGERPYRRSAGSARPARRFAPRDAAATSLRELTPSDERFLREPLTMADWGDRLQEWASAEGVEVSEGETLDLLKYATRILAWSRRMRLVGREDPEWLLREQIAPSLLVVRGVEDASLRYVDIGSGGGLPAVVASIARRGWDVRCVESVRKKCLFVADSARDLGLDRLQVFRGRAEAFAAEESEPKGFDLGSSRGVGRPGEVLPLLAPLLRSGGVARVFVPLSEVEAAVRDGGESGWELVDTVQSSLAPVVVQAWRRP